VWHHAVAGDVAELGSPVGRCRAMAMSPSAMERREHHLVGDRVRWPDSRAGDRGLQCCNRSRYSAGQQPQPLPEATSSDPMWRVIGRKYCRAGALVGALQGDGHVPGRDGVPGSSPGGRPGPAAWSQEGGARGGASCSAATALIHRRPAAPASSRSNKVGSGVACYRR